MDDQILTNFLELDQFLKIFMKNLSTALDNKIIKEDYFATIKNNEERESHSRIWGLIAKTGYDLNYTVEIEAKFRRFYPDILIWK